MKTFLLFLLSMLGAAMAAEPAAPASTPAPATAATPAAKKGKGGLAYPPVFSGAQVATYKTVGDTKLALNIFNPEGHKASDSRAAIVFFFGGGWTSGSPGQFEQQCRYLASRGMVAITADYRVASRHQVKAAQCVADAKSAIRYVRAHAKELGVDPKRIAAGGGSAGGHIAGCTGTLPGLDEAGEDKAVSSVPDAMVLFNPALTLAPVDGNDFGGFGARLPAEKLGAEPVAISPTHNVKAGVPPTIVFHGKADTTVPFATVEVFAAAMKKAGNRCEVAGFEGQQHGFFNYGRGDNAMFRATLTQADKFLASIGWLSGEPTVEKFFSAAR
ncbi:MAG: alpha/beta hydrolase [Chthoniobacteraceae bacterium]